MLNAWLRRTLLHCSHAFSPIDVISNSKAFVASICYGCMHPVEPSLSDVFMLQDEASYVAGERAALLRAFRETLPSQQALGSLFHAVQHLTKRIDQEGNDMHQVSYRVKGYRFG